MDEVMKTVMTTRYADLDEKWKIQQKRTENDLKLAQGFAVADMYLTQQYLDHFPQEL